MAQQLIDMIARTGGADGIAAMAARVGLTPDQAQASMTASIPAVAGRVAKQVQAGNGNPLGEIVGMASSMLKH